jgi:hypothetical protein
MQLGSDFTGLSFDHLVTWADGEGNTFLRASIIHVRYE